jgi:hypothetical protein
MLGILLGAAVLGVVIVVIEGADEFPGWWNLILCVLVAGIPMGLIDALLPRPLGLILGAVVGALAGGLAVSWRCGMSYQRASIAAGIWLAFEIGLGLFLQYATA